MGERPEPEPLPVATADSEVEPLQAQDFQKPETFIGIDPETGLEKEFTEHQVNRMSSEEYKRTFRLRSEDQILCRRSW